MNDEKTLLDELGGEPLEGSGFEDEEPLYTVSFR